MQLPVRNLASGNNPFNDFSGGGYFYLDHRDRAVLSTNDRHVLEVAIASGPSFVTTRDVDLSQELASNDGIISVLPDWRGRFWFVTRRGVVGTIDRGSGEVKLRPLSGEGISNSFSVDETGGVFIVSDRALYRFDAGPNGGPTITWRIVYPNSGIHKPSQSDAGSGTTPDLMGNELVAITDNADPMNVQVYRRAADLNPPPGKKKRKKKRKRRAAIILSAATNTAAGSTATTSAASTAARSKKKRKKKRKRQAAAAARQVCSVPVFRPGASATDNSLITTNKAIVVENNYGYTGIGSTMNGAVTEPGLIRIDVVKKDAKAKKRKKRKKKRKRHTTNILSAATKTAAGSTATNAAATAARSKKKRKKRRKGETAYTCRTAWTSSERAPSVVPKLSLANGLVYAYTKPPRADDVDAWFLTALDFRSGRTVFSRLAGSGFGYNNNYAPVTLGPDGTAYVGVLGGLVAFPVGFRDRGLRLRHGPAAPGRLVGEAAGRRARAGPDRGAAAGRPQPRQPVGPGPGRARDQATSPAALPRPGEPLADSRPRPPALRAQPDPDPPRLGRRRRPGGGGRGPGSRAVGVRLSRGRALMGRAPARTQRGRPTGETVPGRAGGPLRWSRDAPSTSAFRAGHGCG